MFKDFFMRKFILFITILFIGFALVSCMPSQANAQNIQKWFCSDLKLNAVGTHANVPNVNVNGAGIMGSDTMIFLDVNTSNNYTIGWWSVASSGTYLRTGTTSYISIRASYDGIHAFDLPGSDTVRNPNVYKYNGTNTPFYKWTITSNGRQNYKTFGFPYPYMVFYVFKGQDSTTVRGSAYIERTRNSK